MSIIRRKIRFNNSLVGLSGGTIGFTGTTINLTISLSSNDNLIEYQQEIDRLTQFTTLDLVNPVTDSEKKRFKLNPNPTPDITLNFQFYSTITNTYLNSFLFAGFTGNEIATSSDNLLNSFFILDFYDTFDINSQTKIFTTYLTKLLVPVNGITYSQYSIGTSNNNQLYRWYVPLSYIESQTGSTAIGYVKLSFYNAKTGNITTFFNADNINLTTPEYMFFKTELDLINMTWKFLTPLYPAINAKEIANNQLFIDKANNTVENKDDLQQNPPTGNTFTIIDGIGRYVTIGKTKITPPTPGMPTAPILGILTVTAKVSNNAVGNSSVISDGNANVYERGFVWSITSTPTIDSVGKVTSGTGIGTFTANLWELNYATTYYVRAYASNITDTGYSNEVSFTTPPVAPTVVTDSVGTVNYNGATLKGHIENTGGAVITAEGFLYGTLGYFTIDVPAILATNFYASSGLLAALTSYNYKAYATNSAGTSYDSVITFTTPAPPLPTTQTISSDDITSNSATIMIGISNIGSYTIDHSGIAWDTFIDPPATGNHDDIGAITTDGHYYAHMTGLQPNQSYYVRAYITTGVAQYVYGNTITVTTAEAVPPTLGDLIISAISSTNAVGNSSVTSDGGASVFGRGIVWNTAPTPVFPTNTCVELGTGTGAFGGNIYPLNYATNYYARAYAVNSMGTAYSNEVPFSTPPVLPTVAMDEVYSITSNYAQGLGHIENTGGAAITAEGFMIGSNPSYINTNIPAILTTPFNANLGPLAASTTYYVKAYATNDVGTSYSGIINFTTCAPAAPAVGIMNWGNTPTTVTFKATFTYAGSDTVNEFGIVWANYSGPTTSSNKIIYSGTMPPSSFNGTISGISSYLTYYARSYVIMASAPSSPIYNPLPDAIYPSPH
jgi:hypothetical protein